MTEIQDFAHELRRIHLQRHETILKGICLLFGIDPNDKKEVKNRMAVLFEQKRPRNQFSEHIIVKVDGIKVAEWNTFIADYEYNKKMQEKI